MLPHPVRIVITDDLRRSRLTVFFRLLLAIPHLIWLQLWTIVAYVAAIVNWFATLFMGRSPESLHRFIAAFVRYSTHVNAFVFLAGNPFPGFVGAAGSYPIGIEIDPPEPQRRLVTFFRILLLLPALMVQSALSALGFLALLAWFAALIVGRMPLGFRNALGAMLRYSAQVSAYALLLTERYPDSNPTLPAGTADREPGPVRLRDDDDLRRSRLTVFFRVLLAIPHFVWISLWGIVVYVVAFVAWLLALVMGRVPLPLHRFLAAFLRYDIHLSAYVFLVANPFPGFVGREGSYPVDLAIDGPAHQRRLVTLFRGLLGFPALIASACLSYALFAVSFLGWFAALVTGRMPGGLQRLGAWSLGYTGETYAYLLFLTDRYPFSGPPVETPAAVEEPGPELEPLAAAGA